MLACEIEENLHSCGFWLEETSHVLDTEYVDTLLDELVDEFEIVLKRIFSLLGVCYVTAIADYGFTNTTSLLRSVDTKFQLF